MPIEISYEIQERLPKEIEKNLNALLLAFCLLENVPKRALIDLTIVDDELIREINREYRQKDSATDVLSFPQYEREDDLENEVELLYGDVVISLERAKVQAREYGHSLNRELCYLFVHSLMHLRGYDHMDEVEKEEMRLHEERVLEKVGVSRDN